MGDLINLKRARKTKQKNEAARQADLNRAKFGRTKAERQSADAKARRAAETLDQRKLPDKDAT